MWRARMRMELSLEEMARLTKVDLDLLRAIEDSDFERIPAGSAPAVAVKCYAKTVGISSRWAVRVWLSDAGRAPDT